MYLVLEQEHLFQNNKYLDKQKQIYTYNKNRVTAKERLKEIQERPFLEELKKLERYVY
jgi:hypothetical protein